MIAEGIVYRKQLVLIKGLNQLAWIADLATEVAWLRVLIKLRASGLENIFHANIMLPIQFNRSTGQCPSRNFFKISSCSVTNTVAMKEFSKARPRGCSVSSELFRF